MKKILAMILCVLLTLTLGVTAFAAEAADTTEAVTDAAAETVETVETAEKAATGVEFTLERLPANLGYMGVGMLCIIIVMGVLILATVVLNKVTAPRKK